MTDVRPDKRERRRARRASEATERRAIRAKKVSDRSAREGRRGTASHEDSSRREDKVGQKARRIARSKTQRLRRENAQKITVGSSKERTRLRTDEVAIPLKKIVPEGFTALGKRASLRVNQAQERELRQACGNAFAASRWGLRKKREAIEIRRSLHPLAVAAAGVFRRWMLQGSEDIHDEDYEGPAGALDAWNALVVALGEEAALVAFRSVPSVPTAVDLQRDLNVLKSVSAEDGGMPWMYAASKAAPQTALQDLDVAYANAFRRREQGAIGRAIGWPRMRKHPDKGGERRCRLTGAIHVTREGITLPRVTGIVRFMPGQRGYIPIGTYGSASIRETPDGWQVSVRCAVKRHPCEKTVDVDAADPGIRSLLTLQTEVVLPITRMPGVIRTRNAWLRSTRAIARKQRSSDLTHGGRREKGEQRVESNRLKKERARNAKLSRRLANIRENAAHQFTARIARRTGVLGQEDTSSGIRSRVRGRGRVAKAALNRAITESAMLRSKSLFAYKMPLHGGRHVLIPAPYTSQKCANPAPETRSSSSTFPCPAFNDVGSREIYRCGTCEYTVDRDENASDVIHACTRAVLVDAPVSLPTLHAAWTNSRKARQLVVPGPSPNARSDPKSRGEQPTAHRVDPQIERKVDVKRPPSEDGS